MERTTTFIDPFLWNGSGLTAFDWDVKSPSPLLFVFYAAFSNSNLRFFLLYELYRLIDPQRDCTYFSRSLSWTLWHFVACSSELPIFFYERDIILLFQCVYTLESGKDELRLIKGNLSSVPCAQFSFHITWCNLDHRRLPAPFLRIWSISWDSLRKYKHWRGKALKCEQTRENKHILVQLWGLRKSTYYGSVLKASLASSPL